MSLLTRTTLAPVSSSSIRSARAARFINPTGLLPQGNGLFIETPASGEPVLNQPLEDGAGSVLQGALESSNVDPVTQLVELIQTQRAFEMNSQVIQAANSNWQTINSLTLVGDRIAVHGDDPLGVDLFFRFNQTVQAFLDGAAVVATASATA